MKNLKFNRLMMLFVALMTMSINLWGTDVSFTYVDFDGQGKSGGGDGSTISATKDGITISSENGYGNTSNTRVHVYNGATLTISSSGATITSISISSTSSSYDGNLAASYTGLSTTSWSQKLNEQLRFTNITVTYSGSGGSTYTDD